VAAYISTVLVDVCMLQCLVVDSTVTTPKHVTAILTYILILFLRQSLVHSLVNKKL
jgi:hypothetical protein